MPIYIAGSLIWTDSQSSVTIDGEPSEHIRLLEHILSVIKNIPVSQDDGTLLQYIGDLISGKYVYYDLVEFGGCFLEIQYMTHRLLCPSTSELEEQIERVLKVLHT